MTRLFALAVLVAFACADEVAVPPNLVNDFKLYVSGMQMNETLALWCVIVAVTWKFANRRPFLVQARGPRDPHIGDYV
jgi:hypothetical protein